MNRRNGGQSGGALDQNSLEYETIEPQEFPTKWVLSVLSFCLISVVGVIPMIAINIPPSARDELPFWQTGVLYQIYPRSFQDSDGDGIGDLRGIVSHLDYLQDLGVSAVWITSVYKSPMKDFGFDVSDYRTIDPVFGTMQDFHDLVDAFHDRNIKVLMDFIPNHSSSEHMWFQESKKGGANNPYLNFYVWHDGKLAENGTRQPPNNWKSAFGGSAWTWDENRQQYYYHQFSKHQPDLNFRDPLVRNEMKDTLRFWLDAGVDGFRVDAIDPLFEVADFSQDEQRACTFDAHPDDYSYTQHHLTNQQPEVFNVTAEWKQLFDEYEQKLDKRILFLAEVWHQDDLAAWSQYYKSGADLPYNFALVRGLHSGCGGTCISEVVDRMVKNAPVTDRGPDTSQLHWMIGTHDYGRASDRVGHQYMSAMNMLVTLLPGTSMCYYGDELGMRDLELTYEQTQDPAGKLAGPLRYQSFSRDPSRGPMQWDNTKHAGFSQAAQTWLPVHPDYKQINVKAQQKDIKSHLHSFKELLTVMKQPAFQWGRIQEAVSNTNIYSFFRYAKGWKLTKYLVAMNFGKEKSTDDYIVKGTPVKVPKYGTVIFRNKNMKERNPANMVEGEKVDLGELELYPGEGVVIALK